jgi:pimeloyl-ACP methyl ester carboxylesterase
VSDERLVELPGGVVLCVEERGPADGRPLLLVAGLGMQLTSWPDELCDALAAHDLRVVRYDNRDVGRSSRSPQPVPSRRELLLRRIHPDRYDLGDLAGDALGLLRALGLAPAHVVGVSMGGMIAQTLAARHPEAVRTLTSIVASTGARRVGRPARSTVLRMLRSPARDRDTAVERAVDFFRHVGSHGFPFDEDRLRREAARAYDRGHDPGGTGRQLAAILKSGDRTADLARIAVPTLVVHGDRDRMVHPSGGAATAAAIPGARLETIAGMGHDLPRGSWPELVRLIVAHVDVAQPRRMNIS